MVFLSICLENILIHSSQPEITELLIISEVRKASSNHSIIIKIISGECPIDEQASVLNGDILHFLRFFFFILASHKRCH